MRKIWEIQLINAVELFTPLEHKYINDNMTFKEHQQYLYLKDKIKTLKAILK